MRQDYGIVEHALEELLLYGYVIDAYMRHTNPLCLPNNAILNYCWLY